MPRRGGSCRFGDKVEAARGRLALPLNGTNTAGLSHRGDKALRVERPPIHTIEGKP